MSKMYVIFVIILAKTIVNADDSSDETKYVDLLPDKEKDDFLERIARRIFNGVQSKDDRDAVSGEVSDAKLDENDEYVKQILREESLNMRKNAADVDSKKTDIIDPEQLKKDDNVKDESSNKENTKDTRDDAGLVDLTLRDSKRNKRNSLAKTNEDSKIIHLNVGNGEAEPDKENELQNVALVADEDETDVKDIQIKNFRRNPATYTNALEITTENINPQVTQMIDYDAEAEKKYSEEAVHVHSKKLVNTPENNDDEFPKDITQPQEPEADMQNDRESSKYSKLGSTQKIFESLENNDSKEDPEKQDTVLDANTTTNESTNSEVKVIVELSTEKILDKNYSSEGDHNINHNARILKSYTADVDSEKNEKPEVKDILKENTQNDSQEPRGTLVSVAVVHDLETQTNFNKKTATEKTKSEVVATKTMTSSSFTNNEHTTEINEDVVTTTLKTEGLTLASLRTDEKVHEENGLKEFTERRITDSASPTKETNNTKEINSKESVGKDLNNNMLKDVGNYKNIDVNNIKNEDVNQVKVDQKVYDLANDMIKVLRTKIKPTANSDKNNLEGLRALYKATKPIEYKVYAVSEGKQPFMQKEQQTGNKENPYYVPIYNYSPDHAYYNPNNRLGPNADDNDENVVENLSENEREDIDLNDSDRDDDDNTKYLGSDELVRAGDDKARDKDVDDLVRGYNNYKKTRKFRFGDAKKKINDNKPYKLKLPTVVHYPKFTDIILNPNDYSDIDYYYGRTHNKSYKRNRCEKEKKDNVFPDSSEEDHPYNNMNTENNLKDHMRAVRQLLFKQQHFGYIPEITTTEPVNSKEASTEGNEKNVLRSKPLKGKHHNQASNKNIAMDYFFGRMNDDVETETRAKKVDSKYTLSTDYYQDEDRNVPADSKYKDENGKKYSYKIIYQKDLTKKDNKHKNRLINNINNNIYEILYKMDATHNNVPYKDGENYNTNKNKPKKVPDKNKSVYNEIKPATPSYDVPNTKLRPLRAKKTKETTPDFARIREVLSIADAKDLLPTLDKLMKLNLTTRTNDEVNLEPFLIVLGDMVKNNAKALKQYDWLQTTVDIQAALLKLMDMADELHNNITISQPDLQLLKYTIYLHKSAKAVQVKDFRKKKRLLPRNRKKKKGIITQSGLLDRQWLYRMLAVNHDKIITIGDLKDFNEFLNDLQYYLYDLHTAVQQIADITKFSTQRWFENLKEVYLDTKTKSLLEVLLHISTTRLLDLVEESAENGVENDFLTYVMNNENEVQRAKEELIFSLKIIDELKFN